MSGAPCSSMHADVWDGSEGRNKFCTKRTENYLGQCPPFLNTRTRRARQQGTKVSDSHDSTLLWDIQHEQNEVFLRDTLLWHIKKKLLEVKVRLKQNGSLYMACSKVELERRNGKLLKLSVFRKVAHSEKCIQCGRKAVLAKTLSPKPAGDEESQG